MRTLVLDQVRLLIGVLTLFPWYSATEYGLAPILLPPPWVSYRQSPVNICVFHYSTNGCTTHLLLVIITLCPASFLKGRGAFGAALCGPMEHDLLIGLRLSAN